MAEGWGSRASGNQKRDPARSSAGWGSRRTPRPKKDQGFGADDVPVIGGVLGFGRNLAEDVGSTAYNLVPGLYRTGEAVVQDVGNLHRGDVDFSNTYEKVLKPIGQSYRQTYGPLAGYLAGEGDISKFLDNLYEHPLGPLLDVATIVTLGGAAAAKGGALAGKTAPLKQLEYRTPSGEVVKGKTLSRNPVIRSRQEAVHNLLNRFDPETRGIGEYQRAARELSRIKGRDAMRLKLKSRDYLRAAERLNREERAALNLIGDATHPKDIAAFLRSKGVDTPLLNALDNPKLTELFESPSPRLQRALDAADGLSLTLKELKLDRGYLGAVAAEERPWLHLRLMSGAKFDPDVAAMEQFIAKKPQSFKAAIYRQFLDGGLDVPEGLEPGAWVRAADRDNVGRVVSVTDDNVRVHFVNRAEGTEAKVDLPRDLVSVMSAGSAARHFDLPIALQGGKSVDELRAELKTKGRREPQYFGPDRMEAGYVSNAGLEKMGGGRGPTQKLGSQRQNKGVLFQTGRLALEPDLLGPEFLRTVKKAHYDDIHEGLIAAGREIAKGDPLPKGWSYLRRKPSEKIPYTQKVQGRFEEDIARLVPDADDMDAAPLLDDGFSTRKIEDAHSPDGKTYIALPERTIKAATGEFARSSSGVAKLFNRATQVWRALVLGTRLGFLVNNVVGNNLLYALRNAGPDGLKAYLSAVRTAKGPEAVSRLLKDPKTRDLIDDSFIAEFFPEQIEGTFGVTQMPKLPRSARKMKAGIIPATQAVAEGTVRRAAVTRALMRSPEVKSRLKAMPDETKSFKEAARKELESNPALVREVSDKVNSALGDYFSLSNFERHALRSVQPFYAWYRAITVVTVKLPLEAPGRAVALVMIGKIGEEDERLLGKLPSYLRGAIRLGGNEREADILLTQAANPFSTPIDLGTAAMAPFPGAPVRSGQEFTGTLNPFVVMAAQMLASMRSGRPANGEGAALAGLRQIAENLPPVRLALGPRSSDLYGERTRLDELLSQSGYSRRRVRLKEARRRAEEGR